MIIRACYTKLTSSKLQFCSLYQLNWLFLSYMATEGNLTDSCTCCGSKSSQHCHLMEQHVNYIKGSRFYMRLTRRPYSFVQYFASFLFFFLTQTKYFRLILYLQNRIPSSFNDVLLLTTLLKYGIKNMATESVS